MEKYHLTPSSPDWLQKFQWSVTAVIEALGPGEEGIEKYAEIANSWNETMPPEELQRKWVFVQGLGFL